MPSMSKPLCLIESGSGNELIVNEKTVEHLASLSGPVVVVGIAGLFRTGKSYLMNLLAGSKSGFNLGSTIEAETKGIWILVVDHPTKDGMNLVLLDTEGLGDTAKGDRNHDIWIFVLTLLLSSTLVYNSRGTIDNDAVEKLQFITEIADHIKLKKDDDDENSEFDKYFPGFVWGVRDFTLDLKLDGREITSDEYLEKALQLKNGTGKKIQDFNLPRQCIKQYFPTRKCFTFHFPVNDFAMFEKLDTLRDDQLNPEFMKVVEEFKQYIYSKSKPKTLNGRLISGRMLAEFLKVYVSAIKKGKVPCIESAVKTVSQLENDKAANTALTRYKASMSERAQLPTETQDELLSIHRTCEKEAIAAFQKMAINDDDQAFQKKLTEEIQEEYRKFCSENEQASTKRCDEILKELCIDIDRKVSNANYMVSGGYKEYCQDVDELKIQFNAKPGKGIKSAEVLNEFLKKRSSEGSNISAADKKITEEEKKQSEEREKKESAEKKRQEAEEELNKMKKRDQEIEADRQREADRRREEHEQQRHAMMEAQQNMDRLRLMGNMLGMALNAGTALVNMLAADRENNVVALPMLFVRDDSDDSD